VKDDLFRLPGAQRRDPDVEARFSDIADPMRLMVQTRFERNR